MCQGEEGVGSSVCNEAPRSGALLYPRSRLFGVTVLYTRIGSKANLEADLKANVWPPKGNRGWSDGLANSAFMPTHTHPFQYGSSSNNQVLRTWLVDPQASA